ncbi:DUF551 domain-containing protein [Enterobacter hormaechei]|uniref:DUF551 domain-containing protein n=1 Tax=Enterobacter hormaechei TaxID=158836 RepID=UPI0010BF2749|nr:DUF551 domain-containing protein [Enterobacter hormaechei]QWS89635.1 DUF551 domain-containing protein [Enterobacter hormaechei]
MSTITKERVANLLQFNSEGSDCHANAEQWEVHELARIALASLEAEPVAYIIQDSDARGRGEKGILRYFANMSDEDINEYEITVTPLYTAPPAPVSVPDAMEMDDDFDSAFEHGKAVGWNAYRAAMLQSFGNFEQLNSPVIPDGWVACSERMPPRTPDTSIEYLVYETLNNRVQHDYWNVPDGNKSFQAFWNHYSDAVTHWMPLPAAPQQEGE